MRPRSVLLIATAFWAALSVHAEDLFKKADDEFAIGPLPKTQKVSGVNIETLIAAFIAATPVDDAFHLRIRVVAELSDLQKKIGTIVDTVPLPNDDCDLVARIWGKELTVAGATATLVLHGDVEKWVCLGPLKTKATQPFDAAIPFTIAAVPPDKVGVILGQPTVDLGGSLGGVTSGILRIAGVDINAVLHNALIAAIDPDLLQALLPEEFAEFQPAITSASLLSNEGTFAVTVSGTATVPTDRMRQLLELLHIASAPE